MSKIKKITVSNLKAISQQTADFNGCTAIITGGNNKGKTSFLRSLFDRVRGIKAEQVLKEGATEGFAEAELTTGEKIKWEFNDKGKGFKEKLTYITEKDIRTPLTMELRNRFAPDTFDVDKFLTDPPAKQRKTLQDLAGLDFTDIDSRFDVAYKERTAANTRAADAKVLFENTVMPVKVEAIDLVALNSEKKNVRKELNELYLKNKAKNEELRNKWNEANDKLRTEVAEHNNTRVQAQLKYDQANEAAEILSGLGFTDTKLNSFVGGLFAEIKALQTFKPLPEPEYITELPDNAPLLEVEEKINKAIEQNKNAGLYNAWLQLQTNKNTAAELAIKANEAVQAIEVVRTTLIQSAKMPEGFGFTTDGITYNNLPFTREQLSSSGIYIAALKLASMKIGEVRSLHFDASFLDKNSLAEIEAWATSQDLQLLIERPDFEGGEIEYQIIQQC